jgi:NTP pyrophosphatase (non-canonical NTP hydrolase)
MSTDKLLDVDTLMDVLDAFARERNWEPFHTPRNLVLALTGEVGELAEIFQWMTDKEVQNIELDEERYRHVQQELADVLLYLVRLSSVLKIDLNSAVADKLVINALKYPPLTGRSKTNNEEK